VEADSKLPYDPAEFTVVVRCEAGSSAWARDTWQAVYSALHGLRNTLLPGGVYLVFMLGTQSSPFMMGPDENGRHQYSGDYRSEVLNETEARE
jgi:hypothetical protein